MGKRVAGGWSLCQSDVNRGHAPGRDVKGRLSVLECGSPLPLWNATVKAAEGCRTPKPGGAVRFLGRNRRAGLIQPGPSVNMRTKPLKTGSLAPLAKDCQRLRRPRHTPAVPHRGAATAFLHRQHTHTVSELLSPASHQNWGQDPIRGRSSKTTSRCRCGARRSQGHGRSSTPSQALGTLDHTNYCSTMS
jgi:hypothetical protein